MILDYIEKTLAENEGFRLESYVKTSGRAIHYIFISVRFK
jgi:hypothetical protein